MLSGGSRQRKEASYFSKTNEIEVLDGKMLQLRAEHAAIIENMEKQRCQLADINTRISQLQNVRQENEVRLAELTVHDDKLGLELNNIAQTKGNLTQQLAVPNKLNCRKKLPQ